MSSVLQRLPPGARVVVIRLRSLGDCVLTTPALQLLKQARPDLRVAVVVEPPFRAVFEDNPDVAELLDPDADTIRGWHPELCLNLHGGTRSMILTAVSGARVRAGFAHHRYGWIYHHRIPRAQQILGVERTVHTAEHLASAMFYLGVPAGEIPRARLFAEPPPAGAPYAILHPFASTPEKTWPAESFLELARWLRESCGLNAVFLGGAEDDLQPFHEYRTLAGAPLAKVKSWLAGAALFVGNDSGPAHMAAAFRLPVVVIFGDSDPVVWAPWKTPSRVVQAQVSIDRIPVAEIAAAVEKLGVAA
jgi:ADP-heptose:LPS heptosyltransferase